MHRPIGSRSPAMTRGRPARQERSRRIAMPRAVAFWLVAGVFVLGVFAASAPSPLYRVYQGQLGFSAITLTAIFGVYSIAVLVTLLVTGSMSDYVGEGISARAAMLAGCAILFAGTAITFGGIAGADGTAFLAGTAVAGVGFGLAFLGAFRMVTALAPPEERAGLVAAVWIVNFLAFSVPAVIAGWATTRYGLHSTSLVYCAVVAALVALAAGSLIMRRHALARAHARIRHAPA